MRALTKSLFVVLAGVLLASCGGGGGSDSSGGFTPNGLKVSVQPASTSSTPNSLLGITVRVNNTNDTPVGDGTQVTLQVSPPGVGVVSTTTPTTNIGERATASTAGGIATFRLHTRALGTATLTASVPDIRGPGTTVTATASVAVNAGAPNDPRMTLQATTTTLPIRPLGVGIIFGSPYVADVTLTQRSLDGALVSTGEDQFGAAINPVTIAAFSTLDDGDTDDVNEFEVLLGNGPVDAAGGRATVFVHSFNQAGQAVLTVTAQDPQTGETVSAQQTFTIASGAAGVPGSVVITTGPEPVFIQGVNGPTSKSVEVKLFDGAGGILPTPGTQPTAFNNIQLEIVGGAQGGERLQAGAQSGSLVRVVSNNGVGNAIYASGSRSGPITLRATSDRADNNVDNGIQDPITSTAPFSVSDGRLFDLEITNPAASGSTNAQAFQFSGDPTQYGQFVTVSARDRFSNPVPAGTQIRFGAIDHPLDAAGNFAIAGGDGDPQEGGTTFTAPGGAFTTAGAGAGPGDTLIVFGEESNANRDLESARNVQQIVSPTTLVVQNRFNFNDDTGSSVNNGPVLPYVIGRAVDGTTSGFTTQIVVIDGNEVLVVFPTGGQTVTTDELGEATFLLRYPASKLGKNAILWAQGSGDLVNGTAELITDAERIRFQGAGPARITATPPSILSNRTAAVKVCVADAAGNPIPNAIARFAFRNLSTATGDVNGTAGSGNLAATGADGCVNANVTTANLFTSGAFVEFGFEAATTQVQIQLPGTLALTATPRLIPASRNGSQAVTLFLSDGGGGGIPGQLISGTCTVTPPAGASGTFVPTTLSVSPGIAGPTPASGQVGVLLSWTNMVAPVPPTSTNFVFGSGVCTFTAAVGTSNLTTTVTVQGATAACTDGFSPPPPGCP
jgi:hypothetical protein